MTLTDTATLPVVFVPRDARRHHARARRAGPPVADLRDGRAARAAERGRAQLGPDQRVAHHRPGARRRAHRHRRRRRLLPRQHAQLPRRARRPARDARGRALRRRRAIGPSTLLAGTREGLAFAWHDRQVRVVLVRRHVRRARRLQLQHASSRSWPRTRCISTRGPSACSRRRSASERSPARSSPRRSERATFRAFTAGHARVQRLHARARAGARGPAGRRSPARPRRVASRILGANANSLVQLAAPDHLRGRLDRALPVRVRRAGAVRIAALRACSSSSAAPQLAFVVAGVVGLAATALASRERAARTDRDWSRLRTSPLERGSTG